MAYRNTKKLIVAATICFALASCGNYRVRSYDYININKQGVIQKPVVAELDVDANKQSFTKLYSGITIEQAREYAMADFIKEYNCDLIVHPVISLDATGVIPFSGGRKYSEIKVDLSGYPAKYKNMRTFEPKDTANFIVHAQINNELNKPQESITAKKSQVGKIVGYALGAIAVITVLLSL